MDINQIQTLSDKPIYGLIIFGASGFTGKYVVRESLKFLNKTPLIPLKSIALAGRNPTKITQVLKWATHPNPPPSIPILTADTTDPASLRRIAGQTKLIINCVGPFRLYGEPVVDACVESGYDYLDICGEPEFMEKMEVMYHEKAVENGSVVVSGCGFDSVPAELGFMFNSRQWASPAAPNSVEAYVSLESLEEKTVINYGTYESAVLGIASADNLQKLRRSRRRRARPVIPGSPPPKGPLIEHQKKNGIWAVKVASADAIIVRRTLASLTENPGGLSGINETPTQIKKREVFWSTVKPAHFGTKISAKSPLRILQFIAIGFITGYLGKTAFGRWLLLNFPSVFTFGWVSKTGPSEDEVRRSSFKMLFVGHGFSDENLVLKPDMEIITRIMGPGIGYLTTSIILVQCALVLLSQRDNFPKGGVFTPGLVFGPTDLQKRLEENGISFDVISKSDLFT